MITANMQAAVEMKMELKIGDAVIHKLTKIGGRVEAIQYVDGRTKLDVRTPSGRLLRNLDRQEFFFTQRVVSESR
jgi:hypothetical protein